MRRMSAVHRRPLGISVSETHLHAVLPGGREGVIRSWPLEPFGRGEEGWASFASALQELRDAGPVVPRALAVALLPPLAQARRLELPRLKGGQLRTFLSRNAARYFPSVRETQLGNGVPLVHASPAPYLIAVAAVRVVEAIVRAARDAGFEIVTIVPAQCAWAAAARERVPALRRQGGDVAVHVGPYVEVLHLEHGRLSGIRHLRNREGDAIHFADTIDRPERVAAAYAPAAAGPELLPESVYARRGATRRRLVALGGGALAAAVALVAAGTLWHAQTVLEQVSAQRAALRTSVGRAAVAEHDISASSTTLQALKRVESGAVLWSEVLADLSDNLPQDASLVNLRAYGDSIAAEGVATRGAGVFERLEGAKLIDKVRPAGPIRREVKRGVAPVDRFTLLARVSGSAPLYTEEKRRP